MSQDDRGPSPRVIKLGEELDHVFRESVAGTLTEMMAREPGMSVDLRDEILDIMGNLNSKVNDV